MAKKRAEMRRACKTVAAANGIARDEIFGAVTPPIFLSSTFAFKGFDQSGPYDYSRTANPSRDLLADTIAQLEGGVGAVVTSSGMAAIDLVLSRLGPDDLVVAPHDSYSGTQRLIQARTAKGHFRATFIDQNDAAALAGALAERPALVLLETPSNPLMRIVDIVAVAGQAKRVGAKIAVDNTFLSPALQRPLLLGADFVIHSTTKYLNGHSDVIGGAVVAADAVDLEGLKTWANTAGIIGAPFDSFLTLRGLRTLYPRIAQQQQTAAAIATTLACHPRVRTVHYPGLASHPGHVIARKQQAGFGAMLSFELDGGKAELKRFVTGLRIFTLAESLGGIESLIAHPATMTHVSMGAAAREVAGIGDNLLRLSVGLEARGDLLADLQQALSA